MFIQLIDSPSSVYLPEKQIKIFIENTINCRKHNLLFGNNK